MLKAALFGVWAALCASFAISATIIGMPAQAVAFEIARASLMLAAMVIIAAAVGRFVGAMVHSRLGTRPHTTEFDEAHAQT